GSTWFDAVFSAVHPHMHIAWQHADGQRIRKGAALCVLQGPTRALLSGERTALNFLQMMSGVASTTHAFVERVKGTETTIADTRHTLPGLRSAQRYAVCCGGGANHRLGLYDAILIGENHIAGAGSVTAAVKRARETAPDLAVQVKIDTLEELEQTLDAG